MTEMCMFHKTHMQPTYVIHVFVISSIAFEAENNNKKYANNYTNTNTNTATTTAKTIIISTPLTTTTTTKYLTKGGEERDL